jgi:hypothetical protein
MARTGEKRMKAQAYAAHVMLRGEQTSDERKAWEKRWSGLTDTQKRAEATLNSVQTQVMKQAVNNAGLKQARTITTNDPAAQDRLDTARLALAEQTMKNAAPNTKSYVRITSFEDTRIPGDRIQVSANRANMMLVDQRTALALMAQGGAADQQIDPAIQQLAGQSVTQLDLLLPWMRNAAQAYSQGDFGTRRAVIDSVNAVLNNWATGQPVDTNANVPEALITTDPQTALARAYAVSLNFARDPIDQDISFQLLIPYISPKMSEMGADQTAQVSYSLLEAIGGDFDGDRIRSVQRLATTPDQFVRARSGERSITGVGERKDGVGGRESMIAVRHFEEAWLETYREASSSAQLTDLLLSTRREIRAAIAAQVDDSVEMNRLITLAFVQIRNGSTDAIRDFVTAVMREPELASRLLAKGRQELFNVPERLNRLFSNGMAEFSEKLAVVKAPDPVPFRPKDPIPARQGGPVIRERAAATRGRTMFLQSPAADMFRIFQELRYSPLRTSVEARHHVNREEPLLAELQQLYLQLGQGEIESALDQAYADSEVNARVVTWLQAMSDESAVNGERIPVAVLGSMAVPFFDNGEQRGWVTLTQSLLARSLDIDEAKYGPLIEFDVNLQARFAKLKKMTQPGRTDAKAPIHRKNAGAAFVYVFGQMSVADLAGEGVTANDNVTVDQLYRSYYGQDYRGRHSWMQSAKATENYPERITEHDLPYTEAHAREAGVTPWKALVDSIEEAANFDLSTNDNGDPIGESANQSREVSKQVWNIVEEIHQGMHAAALPEQRTLTLENLQTFLQQNPSISQAVMSLAVYDPKMVGVFSERTERNDDGNVETLMAPWLYEALLMEPKQAELSILLNSAILSYRALSVQTRTDLENPDNQTGHVRDYEKLDDRFHQLFFKLAAGDPTGLNEARFFNKVEEIFNNGGGVEDFIRLLNNEYRGNQAPFVAWYRDVASFDANAMLRFGAPVAGTEQRKAISDLQIATAGIAKTIRDEQLAQADVSAQLSQARDERKQGVISDNGPRMALRDAIQFARQFEVGIGANEMLDSLSAALQTFYAKAADKGVGPDEYAAAAAMDVMYQEFAINYVRVDTSTGVIDLDTVIKNPQILLRGPITIMDRFGNTFEWLPEDPSLQDQDAIEDRIINQLEDFVLDNWEGQKRSDNNPLQAQGVAQSVIRRMLEPSVWQMTADGRGFQQRSLVSDSLSGMLSRDAYSRLYGDNNAPVEEQDSGSITDWIGLVNSSSSTFGGDVEVQRYLGQYLATAASSLEHLTANEAQEFVRKTTVEFGYLLQKVGDVVNRYADSDWNMPLDYVDEDGTAIDLLTKQRNAARKEMRDRWLNRRFGEGIGPTAGQLIDDWMLQEINQVTTAAVTDTQQNAWQKAVSENRRDDAQAIMDEIKAKIDDPLIKSHIAKAEFIRNVYVTHEPIKALITMFGYPAAGDGDANAARRELIKSYVDGMGTELVNRNPWADKSLYRIQNSIDSGTTSVPEEDWNAASRALIAWHVLNIAGNQGASEISTDEFPALETKDGELSGALKTWDPSNQYMFDKIFDAKSPMVRAAAYISGQSRRGNVPTIQDLGYALDTGLGHEDRLRNWTLMVPASAREDRARYDADSAQFLVAMAGQPQDTVALAAASATDFDLGKVAQVGGLDANVVSLSLADEKGNTPPITVADIVYGNPLRLPLQDSNGRMMPLANLHGRFVKEMMVGGQPFDMTHVAIQHPESGYWVLDLDQLRAVLKNEDRTTTVEFSLVTQASKQVTAKGKITGLAHSQYFDGVIDPVTDINTPRSLIGARLSAAGGSGRVEQQNALQASKKGKRALKRATMFSRRQRAVMETSWATDLNKVLHLKAMAVSENGLNLKENDWRFYNADYKLQEMKHFVVSAKGTWSAQQVIQWQAENPGVPITDDAALGPDAKLFVPSIGKLRAMYGDIGPSSINLPTNAVWTGDPTDIPVFDGVTTAPLMQEVPGVLNPTTLSLLDTEFGARRPFTRYSGTRMHTTERMHEWDQRLRLRDQKRARIDTDRLSNPQFNAERMSEPGRKVLAETIQAAPNFNWRAAGVPINAHTSPTDQALMSRAANDLVTAISQDGRKMIFLFNEVDSRRNPGDGVLTAATYENGFPGMEPGPNDLVVLNVDSFTKEQLSDGTAFKRLEMVMRSGADVFIATTADTTNQGILSRYMVQSQAYEQVPGTPNLFQERSYVAPRSTDTESLVSTLTSMNPISGENKSILFHGFNVEMDENGAGIKNPQNMLKERAVVTNIVPTRMYPGFSLPKTSKAQLQVLRKVNELFEQKPTWMNDSEYNSLKKLKGKYDAMRNGGEFPMGQLERGDLIPLVRQQPSGAIDIYFSRYKHEDERWSEVLQQLDKQKGLAVSHKPVSTNFTGFEGYVEKLEASSKHGARVRMRVKLAQFGDKRQVALAGMKYVISAIGLDRLRMPSTSLTPDKDIDFVSDFASLQSKHAYQGVIKNHRTAIVGFGWDMSQKLLQAFREAGNPQMTEAEMREVLKRFADTAGGKSAAYLRELISDRAELAAVMQSNGSPIDFNQPSPLIGYVEATLVYLMGAERTGPNDNPLDHILGPFGGLLREQEFMGATAQELPRLFTEYFDNLPPQHETRQDILKEFQAQLNRDKNGYYILNPDFTVTAVTTKGGKITKAETGRLQIAEVNSTGDNPTFDRFAEQSAGNYEDWSPHTAALATTALGTTLVRNKDLQSSVWRAVTAEGVPEIALGGASGATLLNAMMDIGADAGYSQYQWNADNPAQEWYRTQSLNVGHAYRVGVNTDRWKFDDDEPGKQAGREQQYSAIVDKILAKLHLNVNTQRDLVDYWVRQTIGQFGEKDQESKAGDVTFDLAMQAATDILYNVEHYVLPVVDADVPLLHRDDLAAIFDANRDHPTPWLLREGVDVNTDIFRSKTVLPSDWSGFVHVALGTAETGQVSFDPMNAMATDGILQSYAVGEDALRGLPISRSDLVEANLWDPQTSRLVISIDPRRNDFASEPMILDPATMTLGNMFGIERQGSRWQGKRNLSPERRRRDSYRQKYRKERGLASPVETGIRNYRQVGAQWISESNNVNGVVQAVHDLRHFTTLFNPFLWLGAGVELTVRNVQDDIVGAIMGTGHGASQRLNPVNWNNEEGKTRIAQFKASQKALATNPQFAGMLYADMQFKDPHIRRNWITKFTGFLGKSGDWMQDPTYGQPQYVMARRYLEAVLEYIQNNGIVMSEGNLLFQLEHNPQWVRQNLNDAHRSATARISNMRSLKMTAMGLAIRSIYEIPSNANNNGMRMFGQLFLKTPLMYSGYLANVATNMLGLNTANNIILMYLNGRKAGKFAQRALGDAFIKDGQIDFSGILDTVDLTRSMVSDGVSLSALFLAAAFAGSTGLASGEDDEERRRRRAMQYQQAGIVYDPRQIANDWRNNEAIYLDQWPALAQFFQVSKTGGTPHWIIKQFVDPFIGITRAVETGNMEHIAWGFQDALGAMPLFNQTMAIDAQQTFESLTAEADEAQYDGTDTGQMKALGLLTKAVMAYESMILESSFANLIYQQVDKWDRDPFLIPELGPDGKVVRDKMGIPQPTTALEDFYDPQTGELKQGYKGRDFFESTAAGYAENRATFAFLMSLGTGLQDSQYWRQNMAVKTRKIDKPEVTIDQAKELVAGIFENNGYADQLTALADGQGVDRSWLLSSYQPDGHEALTTLGAEAVIRGVWNGSVKLGDKALDGVYIPYDMRSQLQDMFLNEFTQEGVDLGLSQKDAVARAKLIGYGPYNDSTVPGLFDVIWSNDLSYTRSSQYAQLNTTYVTGPDGKPWATAMQRNTLLGAFGVVTPFYTPDTGRGMPTDQVLNAVDFGTNTNTGMRGLEKRDETWLNPTPEQIGKEIEDAIKKLENKAFTPSGTTSQYTGYGRSRYGSGGGGGGRSYAQNPFMPFLNGMKGGYLDNVPQIYINNINVRRADIARQRFSSERGRLFQWQ